MLTIYHVADHDGKCSGAIVKNLFPKTELLGLNHDMEIPYDLIRSYDKIVVCDISLPLDFMFELAADKDFIWIDHHTSVIDAYDAAMAEGKGRTLQGLRRVGTAACVLTWEYFHPKQPVPEGIRLIGLNDLYDLREPKVRPFEYGLQSLGVNRPQDLVWQQIIDGSLDVEDVVARGQSVLAWIKNRNIRLTHSMAFASEYHGYKCLCANMPQGYSEFYDLVANRDDYDFMCNFFMNKKNCWNLSFYSGKQGVDVSKIAASFGGGGHVGAAGASNLKALPEFLLKGYLPLEK